jgi:multidrug efflux pump subunit AcrB
MAPIRTVAQLRDDTIPYRVPRYNLFPAAEVQGVAAPGVASGTALPDGRACPVLFGMLGVTCFGLLFTPAFYTLIRQLGHKEMHMIDVAVTIPRLSGVTASRG